MGDLNCTTVEGKVKSTPTHLSGTDEMEFTISNRWDELGPDGVGKRTYSRLPIVISAEDRFRELQTLITIGSRIKVVGRLVRRKRTRADGSTYMTTAVIGGHFVIQMTVPTESSSEDDWTEEGDL